MQQNSQEREAFYALYWKQPIQTYKLTYTTRKNMPSGSATWGYLSLISLSDMTDDHAIEVAKKEFTFFKETSELELEVIREEGKISVAAVKDKILVAKITVNDPYKLNIHGIDYLRSKGYNTGFLNWTADQLIEMGWVKLKKEIDGGSKIKS